jgi:hypothetical protein
MSRFLRAALAALLAFGASHAALGADVERHVWHILVDKPDEAMRLAMHLQALSEDHDKMLAEFMRIAKTASMDPGSGEHGGDLGWVGNMKTFVPEFAEAADHVPMWTIHVPVHTQFGYHIILVTDQRLVPSAEDKREAAMEDFEQLIRQRLNPDRWEFLSRSQSPGTVVFIGREVKSRRPGVYSFWWLVAYAFENEAVEGRARSTLDQMVVDCGKGTLGVLQSNQYPQPDATGPRIRTITDGGPMFEPGPDTFGDIALRRVCAAHPAPAAAPARPVPKKKVPSQPKSPVSNV